MAPLDLFGDYPAQPAQPAKGSSVATIVKRLKSTGQDFEWYPSTEDILAKVRSDLLQFSESRENPGMPDCSILDIGAGNGSALSALTVGAKYAIELSSTLIQQMPHDVFVIGSNFYQQTLMDKRVDAIYSNPPYSDFANWAVKVILEANTGLIYLVLPKRWKENAEIDYSLKARRAHAHIVDTFTFEDGPRAARAVVDVIRIDLRHLSQRDNMLRYEQHPCRDPFDIWFNEEFLKAATPDTSAQWMDRQEQAAAAEKLRASNELIAAKGLMPILVELYERDMKLLSDTYLAILSLPDDVVKELAVEQANVKKALRLKIQSLKAKYWQELFSRLDSITTRITSRYREKLLAKLNANMSVDFTLDNATAMTIWVIKQANEQRDPQLVEMVEELTEKGNIQLYKTNQRTIKVDGWRYNRRIDCGPYKIDYQFILHDAGGLRAYGGQLIDDIVTVACTLGYDAFGNISAQANNCAGKAYNYYFMDQAGNKQVLMVAKQFQNGNIHIKLNAQFLLKLNTAFGRLKGWLRTVDDVAEEMDITKSEAAECFTPLLSLPVTGCDALKLLSAA